MSIIVDEDNIDGLSKAHDQTLTKFQEAFPQCFWEGKLDIDQLLNLYGEYIDNDFEELKFEWKGKGAF